MAIEFKTESTTFYMPNSPNFEGNEDKYVHLFNAHYPFNNCIALTYSGIMCHANFTEAPGSYQSPFYPNNYPNNVICETRMTAPVGYRVYLTVCSICYILFDIIKQCYYLGFKKVLFVSRNISLRQLC